MGRFIRRLRLVSPMPAPTHELHAEFPTVVVAQGDIDDDVGAVIEEEAWRAAATFRPFDDAVEGASSDAIAVRGFYVGPAAYEVLTRFQRFVARRNDASSVDEFDAVLEAHRALHDCDKPLVKADLDHALDTWQWMLRLDPGASLAAQLAALFHDIERLESEADARIEQHAADYQAFKDAHARRGADVAYEVLVGAGIEPATAARTRELVGSHERRGVDCDVDLLNDADALSFFSLNSSGYADYFGAAQARKKVKYTLARLGSMARGRLAHVRLREDVRAILAEAMAA